MEVNLKNVEVILKKTKITKSILNQSNSLSFKEIDKNNAYFVYYRNVKSGNKVVNARQASLDIGIIKISEILNHIKELQPSDYFRISRDREFSRNFNAEIYEFKKIINRKMLI